MTAINELIYGLKYEQIEAKKNLRQLIERLEQVRDGIVLTKRHLDQLAASTAPQPRCADRRPSVGEYPDEAQPPAAPLGRGTVAIRRERTIEGGRYF